MSDAYITTNDCCSNCQSKLSNAETTRSEYQQEAFKLSQRLKESEALLKEQADGWLQLANLKHQLAAEQTRVERLKDLCYDATKLMETAVKCNCKWDAGHEAHCNIVRAHDIGSDIRKAYNESPTNS